MYKFCFFRLDKPPYDLRLGIKFCLFRLDKPPTIWDWVFKFGFFRLDRHSTSMIGDWVLSALCLGCGEDLWVVAQVHLHNDVISRALGQLTRGLKNAPADRFSTLFSDWSAQIFSHCDWWKLVYAATTSRQGFQRCFLIGWHKLSATVIGGQRFLLLVKVQLIIIRSIASQAFFGCEDQAIPRIQNKNNLYTTTYCLSV